MAVTSRLLTALVILGAGAAAYGLWVAVARQTPDDLIRAADALGRRYLVAENVDYRQVGDWTGRVDITGPVDPDHSLSCCSSMGAGG